MNEAPALGETPLRVLKAHGEWLYVEKIIPEKTESGLLFIPSTADYKKNPRLRFANIDNTFRARVLSVGSRVSEPIYQGDEIVVWTFAEGDGSRLYTGENVGEKRKMFIKQSDVVCVIERP